jgi:hypothetical protein
VYNVHELALLVLTASRLALIPVVASVLVAGAGFGHRAEAQNAGAAAEAQTLFDEARKLMNKGDFAHACRKFAASQQADPAAGTLLNLANCYEKNGQTASAWVTFKDAAAAARASKHKDWEKTATDHATNLEKVLSRLTARLDARAGSADATAATLQIRRDDTSVGSALLGTAIPVDPGTHTVDASAPGKKPFHVSIDVAAGGERKEVVIPALEDAPPDPAIAVATPAAGAGSSTTTAAGGRDGSGQRTLGLVFGGIGVASGVVGIVTGIMAVSKNSSAKSICPNAGACGSQSAVDDGTSAHSLGTVSTVTLIAGGALLAGGIVTYLLAPHAPSPTSARVSSPAAHDLTPRVTALTDVTVAPLVGCGQAGFAIAGRF